MAKTNKMARNISAKKFLKEKEKAIKSGDKFRSKKVSQIYEASEKAKISRDVKRGLGIEKSRGKAYIDKLTARKEVLGGKKAVKGISKLSTATFGTTQYKGQTLLQKIQAERERQKRMKQMAEDYARMQREAQFNTNQKAVVNNHNAVREQQIRYDNYEQTKLSPGTQAILQRVLRIQTKSNRDNERMQRILRERRIIRDATDIMKTPNMFKQDSRNLDPTGIREDNILMAPNTFKEDPENFILRQKRLNLLQTAEAGNNLKF